MRWPWKSKPVQPDPVEEARLRESLDVWQAAAERMRAVLMDIDHDVVSAAEREDGTTTA